jgi:hypothetical protein
MIKKFKKFTESLNSDLITILTKDEYDDFFNTISVSPVSGTHRIIFDLVFDCFKNAGIPNGLIYIPNGKSMFFTYNYEVTVYVFMDDDYHLYVQFESAHNNGVNAQYLSTYAQIDISESMDFVTKFVDSELVLLKKETPNFEQLDNINESVASETIVKLTEAEYEEYDASIRNQHFITNEIVDIITDMYEIDRSKDNYYGYVNIWFEIQSNNDDELRIFVDDDYWLYTKYIFTSDYESESTYHKIDISDDIAGRLAKYYDIIDNEYREYMNRNENK